MLFRRFGARILVLQMSREEISERPIDVGRPMIQADFRVRTDLLQLKRFGLGYLVGSEVLIQTHGLVS